MSREYFVSVIERRPRLLAAVLRFNQAPPQAGSGAERSGLEAAVSRCEALRGLWPREDKAARPFFSFEEETERLALMSAEELARLARLASASVFSELIAKAVRRDEVLALRQFLGADVFEYAITLGRFQAGTLAAPLAAMTPEGERIADRAERLSGIILASIRGGWPAALQERTAALFAATGLPVAADADAADPLLRQRIWHFLRKILHREFSASWANYFG